MGRYGVVESRGYPKYRHSAAKQYVHREVQLKKAVVLGHSFIRSTSDWCKSRRLPLELQRNLERGVVSQGTVNAHIMGLDTPYRSLEFLHTPLCTTPDMDWLVSEAAVRRPDIAVINTGSNDACKILRGEMPANGPQTAQQLAMVVLAKARTLRREHRVSVVVVMSMIRREKGFGDMDPSVFTKFMDGFNDQLARCCDYECGITYFHVQGYYGYEDGSKSQVKAWAKDSIHPYMAKYRAKMREALSEAISYYDKLARCGKL